MIQKFKERSIHITIFTFFLGLFIGLNFSQGSASNNHTYLDYFHKVYQIIDSNYVKNPNSKKLFFGAIKGMIQSLNDPYSSFLDEKAYSRLLSLQTSKYVGIGIEIVYKNGEIIIITPIDDSPANKAGLQSGDIIKKINGKPIKNKKFHQIIQLIKGKSGTIVVLSIARKGYTEQINFKIVRKPIKINSVSYGLLPDKKVGFIKIKIFNSETTNDFSTALKYFNKKKITKIIVDLRNNPGGTLLSAKGVSNLLLKKGKKIVTVKGRKGSKNKQEIISTTSPLFNGKVLILVNKGSASASEIVSAAIRDNNRGFLVGEKTFGKGSVQNSYSLDSKKKLGIKLTIAKYYTPKGISIHKKGIQPDYKVFSNKVSAQDKKNIQKLYKSKILHSFSKPGTIYNDNTKREFKKKVMALHIKLPNRILFYLLKKKINSLKKRPLYDLEFDKQLKYAIQIINR